ncbi:MAG: hypothetical protein IH914_00665, partial [candidate division Zixibacteria bacterium]|nr:hypothetical protein [candidate division Zixibacteria bacterium]
MSRKLLTLVLTSVFVLSFGLSAFAQNADQKIEITGGTAPIFPDTLNGLNHQVGNSATYNYLVSINTNGLQMNAASLGLVLYSPDGSLNPSGATVSNASMTPFWNNPIQIWAFGPQLNTSMITGSLPELILYGGTGNAKEPNDSGGGLQNNVFVGAITFDVTFSASGVFCIDSSFFPPATDFLAIDLSGNSIGPNLVGGSGDIGVGGVSPSAFCVTTFLIPDLPPTPNPANPSSAEASHCDVLNVTVTASDPDDENDPISYSATTNGAGTVIVDAAGNVSYTPDPSDVGNASLTITINAAEPDGPNTDMVVDLTISNVPVSLTCPSDLAVAKGNSVTTPAPNGVDPDACDLLVYSFVSVSPAIAGTSSITVNPATGAITFITSEADAPGVDQIFTICIEVTDGISTAGCCIDINVLDTAPFCIAIERVDDVFQGGGQSVDIVFEGGSNEVGGFDFLVQYDNSALSLAGVSEGSIYSANGWEFFDFRFGPNGNCGGACPSGKVRIIGLADKNDGSPGGNTALVAGNTFASLDFLVSNDRNLGGQFVPIRFCWLSCGDNSLSSPGGDTLYISRNVFDYVGTDPSNQDPATAGRANITGNDQTFQTLTGAPDECDVSGGQGKPSPLRFVDLKNGGIGIVDPRKIDGRGDINLNGISNEIADAVIYTAYFVSGLSAFDGLIAVSGPDAAEAAIAASDVNADGIPLSVADLVYLIRIIVGDALPINKLAHGANSVEFSTLNGVISTDTELGAALFVFDGNADVKLLA